MCKTCQLYFRNVVILITSTASNGKHVEFVQPVDASQLDRLKGLDSDGTQATITGVRDSLKIPCEPVIHLLPRLGCCHEDKIM